MAKKCVFLSSAALIAALIAVLICTAFSLLLSVPASAGNIDLPVIPSLAKTLEKAAASEPCPECEPIDESVLPPEPVPEEEAAEVPGQPAGPAVVPKPVTVELDPSLIEKLNNGSCADPVPESAAVGDDYFSDAIFLGNSRTQGLFLYNSAALACSTSYAYQGLNVKGFFSTPYVNTADGRALTVPQAISENKTFTKAYLMFGINELGWPSLDTFIQYYSAIIDVVLNANPDATVYIQSVIPVTAARSSYDAVFNNVNIAAFNIRLRELAKVRGVYYVDVAGGITDENGALPENGSFDGIHLNPGWCVEWYNYLKTHTAG